MKPLLYLTIFSTTCMVFAKQGNSQPTFSYTELKTLIDKTNSPTITKIIAQLPRSMRSQFALVYKSSSLQKSSPLNPRAILYNNDASLIVSFNNHPEHEGFSKLEIIEFDSGQSEFFFHDIEFSESENGQKSAHVSEPNPDTCHQCHRIQLRPIWDPYPINFSVYGSSNNTILRDSTEDLNFQALVSRKDPSRYDSLVGLGKITEDLRQRYQIHGKPNTDLGNRINRLNFMRLRQYLNSNPQFIHFKYAIQASLSESCSSDIEDFIPVALKNNLDHSFQELLARTIEHRHRYATSIRKYAARYAEIDSADVIDPIPFLLADDQEVSALRYVVESLMGISMRTWTMTRVSGTFIFTAEETNIHSLGKILKMDLEPEIGLADLKDDESYCHWLKEKSLDSLRIFLD